VIIKLIQSVPGPVIFFFKSYITTHLFFVLFAEIITQRS